jgi:A/G-specific adenine glycosylase
MIETIYFQKTLLDWYQAHGRHDLPWQNQSPYHVWLSEIMLQQTQVATVLPYYHRFILLFPSIEQLAAAPIDEILKMWAGLGYYHRARNLHKTAQIIVGDYAGQFPPILNELKKLPGIGASTAAAILSQAFDLPFAILDGNVKRVLARFFGIESAIDDKNTLNALQALADACMPQQNCQAYTQAIMDMGATCCKPKNPQCARCPLQEKCQAFQLQKIETIPQKGKRLKRKEQQFDFMAYINDQQEVFLIQRPSSGIWPQLWCFPEGKNDVVIAKTHHELTHIRMNIELHLEKIKSKVMPYQGVWVSENNCHQFGLPKAIENLITKIFLDVKFLEQIPHPVDLH